MSGWESPKSELNTTGQVVLIVIVVFVILCGLWQLMQPGVDMDPGLDQHTLDHWR